MSQTPKNGGGDANESLDESDTFSGSACTWMQKLVDGAPLPPSQMELKEENKRLRTLFHDAEQKYGANAKNAEELALKRQAALKIRNKQLLKRSYRIDPTVPARWDAYVILEGQVHRLQASPVDQRTSRTTCLSSVAVRRSPASKWRPNRSPEEASGSPTTAATSRPNEDVVLKEYLAHEGQMPPTTARRHEFANQLQTVASYFAGLLFMADCEEKIGAEKLPATSEVS
ncbi:hypothetical protein M3Y99_01880800 [Aphelenchoides fujianensis]|nr:hypothetical protein M3Y99_01880800 [Aphelenchoides fujianensis]